MTNFILFFLDNNGTESDIIPRTVGLGIALAYRREYYQHRGGRYPIWLPLLQFSYTLATKLPNKLIKKETKVI
jgi:hypothetical protein